MVDEVDEDAPIARLENVDSVWVEQQFWVERRTYGHFGQLAVFVCQIEGVNAAVARWRVVRWIFKAGGYKSNAVLGHCDAEQSVSNHILH